MPHGQLRRRRFFYKRDFFFTLRRAQHTCWIVLCTTMSVWGSLDGRCIVKTMLMRSFGLTTRLLVLSCFVSADGGVRACATSALNTFTRDRNPQILIFLFIFSLRSQGHVSFLAVSKKERNVSYIFMPVRKSRPILNPPKSVERFRWNCSKVAFMFGECRWQWIVRELGRRDFWVLLKYGSGLIITRFGR